MKPAAPPPLCTPTLATIGYEGSTVAAVTAALTAAGVALLIDVRAVPSSRKPGFSKHILAASLAAAGIGYVHLRPLGTPKAGRDAVRRGDVGTMQRIFAAHMQGDEPRAALAEATARAQAQPACLLCFEHDPRTCHRTLVAELVTARTRQSILHIEPIPQQTNHAL